MKKKIIALFCVIVISLLAFAACQPDQPGTGTGGNGGTTDVGGGTGGNKGECQHTFSNEWYTTETEHWHPATCEHGENKNSLGTHADANEDGKCDVCEYEVGHSHKFAADWTITEEKHWKAATCTHTDAKGEEALHSDENIDGKCDVCSGHVHNVNAIGYCTHSDCGKKVKEVDTSSLANLAGATVLQSHFVNGANIVYSQVSRNNVDGSIFASTAKNVEVIFGKDGYTYSKVSTNALNDGVTASDVLEKWMQLMGSDVFCAISADDGNTFECADASTDDLYGFYYTVSTLADGHGAENILYALYERTLAEGVSELVVTPDVENRKLSFSFNILVVEAKNTSSSSGTGDENTDADTETEITYNVHYYELEVSFTYNENFALTSLDIKCDCYTSDAGASDSGFSYDEVDFQYNTNTNSITFVKYDSETETYVPNDNPIPDTYTFSITQTIGERTAENPNPKSKFIPESYDVYTNRDDNTGALSSKVDAIMYTPVGEVRNLYFGNYSPASASINYAPELFTFVVYDKDGNEIEGVYDDYLVRHDLINVCFTGITQRSIFIIPRTAGTYKLVISYNGKITHEITLIAGVVDHGDIVLGDNQFLANVNDANSWSELNEVTFTAGATGIYKFNLPLYLGMILADDYDSSPSTTAPKYDHNTQDASGNYVPGSFTMRLTAGQTVRFYANARYNGTYVISYVFYPQ